MYRYEKLLKIKKVFKDNKKIEHHKLIKKNNKNS